MKELKMDNRLKSILNIALRPETGDGESMAALNAAKRIISASNINLGELIERALSPSVPPKEKIVYRDVEKVVYRDRYVYKDRPQFSSKTRLGIAIPQKYLHDFIKSIVNEALKKQVSIEIIDCYPEATRSGNGPIVEVLANAMIIEMWCVGAESSVKSYVENMRKYTKEVNQGLHSSPKPKANKWIDALNNMFVK